MSHDRRAMEDDRDPEPLSLVVLIPVFNDWQTARQLLAAIDRVLAAQRIEVEILLVDDGSTISADAAFACPPITAIRQVSVLELHRNLGHQRAIAVALSYIHDQLEDRAVLIMDGDGEDSPEDIPRLVAEFEKQRREKIIFAARERRSESFVFKFFYRIYQMLHHLLTGLRIRVGNFSIVPPRAVAQLVVSSEIWNHYAAAVFNSRIEHDSIPTHRAQRLGGKPTMDFTALVVHGLSALSVYSHTIGVRLLCAVGVLAAVSLLGLFAILATTLLAGVSWTGVVFAGALLVLLAQMFVASMIFVFIVLAGRQTATFIPARDYPVFVRRVTVVDSG
ncbi:MAG: glycosyltransferase [bacterium]|nr:glycosyltransferase [bacterium]